MEMRNLEQVFFGLFVAVLVAYTFAMLRYTPVYGPHCVYKGPQITCP